MCCESIVHVGGDFASLSWQPGTTSNSPTACWLTELLLGIPVGVLELFDFEKVRYRMQTCEVRASALYVYVCVLKAFGMAGLILAFLFLSMADALNW